ncbi:Ppx/GppA phosphatase family protein [Sulfurimonas sp.]|uniref:Ppx/GppA phosphatase family protein n=1 Tax=Sulfurimonas sp. TaxID=2022749 RepID=UPI0026013412|nr:Ppx/GppA phosphatase family protein [Sulfurimonas sp.]MDD5158211.1 Ppx/GppA phosphatase family protein [Sulfurimonas sp.]
MAKRVAVIDIGSNSVRMVVYEKSSRFSFHILHEAKSGVRLSQNAYKNGGNLQEPAMQRAYDALADFTTIIDSFKARKVLCVATSALRDAPNKAVFINKIRNSLGINIKVINGQREAYLGAIACANLLPEQNNAISIDIGGGSTEFAIINKQDISSTISLDLGTVRLKELFFDSNEIESANIYIDSELDKLDALNPSTMIGIGGTFRAIANAILKNSGYPLDKLHAYEPAYDDFSSILYKILDSNNGNLKKLGIKESRFDIIKPGALILLRVLKRFKIKELVTSGVGVREGVYLCDLLRNSNDRFPRNYNVSLRNILDLHTENLNHSNQLAKVAKEIFDITHCELGIDKKYRYELSTAAKLLFCGSTIHFYSSSKHGYNLIQDTLEFGFTHKQITLISTLVKYAKRKLPSSSHINEFKPLLPDVKTLNTLNYILSLSIALLAHRPRNIDFELSFSNRKLLVTSKKSMYLARDGVKALYEQEYFSIKFL